MNYVYLLIGSNKGNRLSFLEEARKKIAQQIGLVLKCSSLYETEPWGFEDECLFLNQCLMVKTSLEPYEILECIRNIELQSGRERKSGVYENRNLDIDIIFYDDKIINKENLKIPHPLLHERKFTLVPLAEINPDLIHPVFHQTISELLSKCADNKMVVLYKV